MQIRDARAGGKPAGHLAAVVIASERKQVFSRHFQDMIDVAQRIVARGLFPTVVQEVVVVVEPDDAAAIGDLAQLPVSEIALVPADGARIGM